MTPSVFIARVLQKSQDATWFTSDIRQAGATLNFGCHIWGGSANPQVMMVRACFEEYLDYVLRIVADEGTSVIVGGSKGIGKSFFGLYICADVLKKGSIVIYEYCGKKMLLIPPNVDPEHLAQVNTQLRCTDYQSVEAGHAYSFSESMEEQFEDVVTLECLYYIVDVGEGINKEHVYMLGNPRRIVITSPNSGKIKRLGEGSNKAKTIFFPSWSWEEIQRGNDSPALKNVTSMSFACSKTPEELKRLFDIYGGVPRHVFRENNADEKLHAALSQLNLDVLKEVFTSKLYQIMPILPEGMGCILRIEPVAYLDPSLPKTFENAQKFKTVLASPQIAALLRKAFVSKSRMENLHFYNAVKGIKAFASFSGYFLEAQAHDDLINHDTYYLEQLSPTTTALNKVNWPKMKSTKTFNHQNMLDLTSMDDLTYAHPTFDNFPSVDSFAVMPASVFDPQAKGMCLAMFQITVAAKHREKGPDLEAVHDRVCNLKGIDPKKGLPVYLVFVTTDAGVRVAQHILKADGKQYEKPTAFVKRVKQFALMLGDKFNDVAAAWAKNEED